MPDENEIIEEAASEIVETIAEVASEIADAEAARVETGEAVNEALVAAALEDRRVHELQDISERVDRSLSAAIERVEQCEMRMTEALAEVAALKQASSIQPVLVIPSRSDAEGGQRESLEVNPTEAELAPPNEAPPSPRRKLRRLL